jgi:hypothetical protein
LVGISKGLEFPVRGLQFGGAFKDASLQFRIGDAQIAHRQRTRQNRQDHAQLERLQNVIERAGLHRRYRRGDGALAGHDDADQIAVELLCRLEQGNAVHPRHHEVGQQQVEPGISQGLQGSSSVGEAMGVVAMVAQRIAQRPDLGGFVVHDQYPRKRFGQLRLSLVLSQECSA